MILYKPCPSVTTVRTFSISTGLAASTVTPGRTAPLASLATPAIAPVVEDWAAPLAGTLSTSRVTSRTTRRWIIINLYSSQVRTETLILLRKAGPVYHLEIAKSRRREATEKAISEQNTGTTSGCDECGLPL